MSQLTRQVDTAHEQRHTGRHNREQRNECAAKYNATHNTKKHLQHVSVYYHPTAKMFIMTKETTFVLRSFSPLTLVPKSPYLISFGQEYVEDP